MCAEVFVREVSGCHDLVTNLTVQHTLCKDPRICQRFQTLLLIHVRKQIGSCVYVTLGLYVTEKNGFVIQIATTSWWMQQIFIFSFYFFLPSKCCRSDEQQQYRLFAKWLINL